MSTRSFPAFALAALLAALPAAYAANEKVEAVKEGVKESAKSVADTGRKIGHTARDVTKEGIEKGKIAPARLTAVADAVNEVAAFPDPLGVETAHWTRPNGLDFARVRTPIDAFLWKSLQDKGLAFSPDGQHVASARIDTATSIFSRYQQLRDHSDSKPGQLPVGLVTHWNVAPIQH